ncbi:MAG: hypothetical protein E6J78_08700 [Deltaproteobacteria bacterium]|nr:MAG: hypothetical protein E6J78_08700 [Deltaproteobacteria bacterium]
MRTCTALLLFALPAAALDPRFAWETLETPHFLVHYHQGMYRYAQRTARAGEESYRRLAPLLDHEPARTHIVVEDDTDFANGNATPVLYNLIHAYAPPPDSRSTIGDYDDNIFELISHEYTHILHLDTVLGLPEATNNVFGKLWIPNGAQPLWFIEGMAVFAESEVSGAGRLRSSQEEMMLRAEVLSGTLPRIDRLSNAVLEWPRGFGQYTVGSRFVEWIREQYGLGALRDLSHDYGSRAIPLAMNLSAERVLGSSYLELYKEFAAAETQRAQAMREEVRAQGETPIEQLTHLGEWVRTPRFSPDGNTLYYTWSGPDRLPEIRSLEPARCCEERHVQWLYSDGAGDDTIAVDERGRLVYARRQVYQEFESLQDLYSVDPGPSGAEQRLTRGLRASRPDVAPDGAIVFVWRRPGGRTAIAELTSGEPRILFEDPEGEPVDSPRYSPDGALVAFLHHRGGSWDVRIVSRDGGALIDVTRDRSLERDPAWTKDGRWLLFSSDRTGVYNIFAWSVADHGLYQVTNVVLGAFEPQPSPDGATLALVAYSSRGYDVARMRLDPERFRSVTAPPLAEQRPPPTPPPAEEVYPSHPYQPWPTLRPHFWLPYLNTDALGTTVGMLTAGLDAVDRHEYAATLWYGLTSKLPGWDVYYVNHSLYPDLSFELLRDLTYANNWPSSYTERELGGSATATFPFSRVERSHALSLNYELFSLATHTNPYAYRVGTGTLAAATLTWSYSDAFRFVRSVSSEQGQRFSISLRASDPALGSSFSFWQLSTAMSRYFLLPWASHHALALRASFGISRGDLSFRHLYSLGGFQQTDAIRAVINPTSAPLRLLRGYTNGAFYGEEVALGTAEYRFPIWTVETGAWTLPFFLRRFHGALYTDVGDAWTAGKRNFKLHAGAGAELRAEVVLGYILPADLRFGCARGLEKSDVAILDCYAALGGVF